MADAKRDNNRVATLLGVSNSDNTTPVTLWADPSTHRLLVDLPTGSGDVTGPAGATADDIAVFDGATGKIIKDGGAKISDLATTANSLKLDQTTPQTIINGQPIQDILTASQIVATDSNKKLQSLAVATYPSLTELSYTKGVTSAIQTQLGGKLGTALTSANIFVGNGSNVATGVVLSGDASLSNAGVLGVNKTRLNVRNETGSTLASTKAVYVSGFNNLPLVTLADNTVEVQHNVVGITIAPINNAANGFIATTGQCDAETNAWTVGTELYLSTAGALTSTAPTSGSVKHIAIVTVQANYPTGKLLVYQYPEENYLAGGTGVDTILRTGDAIGVNKFSFRDYANAEVAFIDSNGVINSTPLTASEIVITDASKNLVSAPVATYPSLTELSYVKGLSSAIQTQISGLVTKATYDAHSILYATTNDTPVALTVGEQTVVGRATGGNITALAIDSDLTSVSANDDTIPSAKATKAMGDLKLPLAGGTMTGKITKAGTDEVGKTYTPATGAQTVAIDCAVNNIHVVSGHASGTAITFTIANATNSQPFIISILQGGTTVSTITAWFATVRWAGGSAPTLTATLNKRDTFGFIRTGADTYDGFIIGQNC